MSTTRRTVLRGLAASPVALALPSVALAATTASTSPDAALIAQADKVEALAIRAFHACGRVCELSDAAGFGDPSRPRLVEPPAPKSADEDIEVERTPDGRLLAMRFKPADPAAALAHKQACEQAKQAHEAAVAAWEVDRGQDKRLAKHRIAERLSDRLYRRLEDETLVLIDMAPTTVAGLAAKACVAVVIDPHHDYSFNEWEHALRASVLENAVALVMGEDAVTRLTKGVLNG